MSDPHYAYLHGFGAGPGSRKGSALATRMEGAGLTLHRPDLRRPSFQTMTVTAALDAMDALDAEVAGDGRPWCLIGSSMGGYLTALWAALNPSRVRRLLLLCPGFDLAARWPHFIGAEAVARWEREGALPFPNSEGVPTPVHWGFIVDARQHPAWPEVPCATHIIHGRRDEALPPSVSASYAAARAHVTLEIVDDDHGLMASLEPIWEAVQALGT